MINLPPSGVHSPTQNFSSNIVPTKTPHELVPLSNRCCRTDPLLTLTNMFRKGRGRSSSGGTHYCNRPGNLEMRMLVGQHTNTLQQQSYYIERIVRQCKTRPNMPGWGIHVAWFRRAAAGWDGSESCGDSGEEVRVRTMGLIWKYLW